MAQPSSKSHLDQDILSVKDKEGLEILGEWLSKEDTKFEKATDRFKKCVDPDLPEKLHTLLETLEFAKGFSRPGGVIYRLPGPQAARFTSSKPAYLVPIRILNGTPKAAGKTLNDSVTYVTEPVVVTPALDFLFIVV